MEEEGLVDKEEQQVVKENQNRILFAYCAAYLCVCLLFILPVMSSTNNPGQRNHTDTFYPGQYQIG